MATLGRVSTFLRRSVRRLASHIEDVVGTTS